MPRSGTILAVAALAMAACSDPATAPDSGASCGLDGGYPCPLLSDYGLVSIADGGLAYAPGVVPYALNTPLFSDYALKARAVWLPPGTQAGYDPDQPFAFPVGTVLIKSFGFPDDERKANPIVTWVETRLLVNTAAGWKPATYLWDAAQQDAALFTSGEVLPISWIQADGGPITAEYMVPQGPTQCEVCHDSTDPSGVTTVLPIGPKARQLNGDYPYPTGVENQLAHWTRIGLLAGAPDPSQAPLLPAWNDPDAGTVQARARAYLEANCAHCHNAAGTASTTGLFLLASEADPTDYGVCKPPVAAGPATGGFSYDVLPGEPGESILVHRLASTTPEIRMPQLGRSVVDGYGLDLVSEWIAGLDGGCGG